MSSQCIAIVGMAGRLPGAPDLDAFWANLCAGVESIERFTETELAESGIESETVRNPSYVKARAPLSAADRFDAEFFGVTPREAQLMDPQHRIFLETAWHALEDAGYRADKFPGAIGVYAGLSLNTYLLSNLCANPKLASELTGNYQTGEYQTLLGNDKDYLTTRVSYKLNLRGPSMTIQTACSTSLVAVAQACQSLLNYQCDMALAGAVSISFPQKRGYLYEPGGLASDDGHCRAFDEKAQGTVFGDGVGIVVLRRLDEALADRDHVYAVIKGYALNNDGAAKAGYTAPSANGQAEVIAMAQAMAGVEPRTIGYIEAHGTATPVGDPIEIAGLTQAFRAGTQDKNFCAIGSVKTNVGHLEVAAGVTGLIKTVLALEHGKIPPSLHFEQANPRIDFKNSPFYVAAKLLDWTRNGEPRRAGVSSFGVGGTNAHIVLEEAPETAPSTPCTRKMHLFTLSAKTRVGLEAATDRLAKFLEDHRELDLADVAYTLQIGRQTFEHRRMLFARDVADAVAILRKRDVARVFTRQVAAKPGEPIAENVHIGALALRWLDGEDVDWAAFYAKSSELRRRLPLPGYVFEQKTHWLGSAKPAVLTTPVAQPQAAVGLSAQAEQRTIPPIEMQTAIASAPDVITEPRKDRIVAKLKDVLKNLSGQDVTGADESASFFDLGFDSLFLTQAGQAFRKEFGVKVTFRQLLEELATLGTLAAYLDEKLPPDAPPPIAQPRAASVAIAQPATPTTTIAAEPPPATPPQSALDLLAQQLAAIGKQLEAMRAGGLPVNGSNGGRPVASPVEASPATPQRAETGSSPISSVPTPMSAPQSAHSQSSNGSSESEPKRFGPYKAIDKSAAKSLTDRQQKQIDELTARYTSRTPKSKAQTQAHRAKFADPRTVSSFNRVWKEMVYPIIVERAQGTRMWDIDGNEFIDLTMGFGTNLLGHAPEFIKDAIAAQLARGIEVGPSTPLAGNVAELITELTGADRVAFCNTGSEAVLAAIRLARTVTGRTRIATTSGFHGICDEVLVRANVVDGVRRSVPVAPGIPDHVVRDVLVVDYGTPESLQILRDHAHELAAVLVEPVQSRRPDLQPREFLHELRRITRDAETALVFDEVITGFRCHPGGAQAWFDVRADIATYGKIMGGGMPIGAVAGSSLFMDALDGGQWQYGDSSFPEVGVTFFAGTYIRHPLAMASSWAVLNYLKAQGPGLQRALNERTREFVCTLNDFLVERGVPLHIENFASIFYLHFDDSVRWGGLLYYYLREKGIHIWEGRPCFLSTAHTEADLEAIIAAFKESVVAMQEGGFLPGMEERHAREAGSDSGVNGRSSEDVLARSTEGSVQLRSGSAVCLSAPAAPKEALRVRDPGDRQTLLQEIRQPLPVYESSRQAMEFSLYFFGNYPAEFSEDKYRIIIEAAKFGDTHGFTGIWIPERHFHSLGGFSPNPALIAAALARETKHLQLRAGSVVLPLHHPVRVAEEWAVVDNLSGGRVGISIASGWHPNDFVFAPENFDRRRELNLEHLTTIQKLWRGESLTMRAGAGKDFTFQIYPMPKQRELPVWLTSIHADSYEKAGELGVGALGYLMNQSVDELADKIRRYREALLRHGHDPARGHVTILLHTFVGSDVAKTREQARKPLCDYLRSFLDNSQKRLESERGPVNVDEEDVDYLLNRAFNDYVEGKALIGTAESCAKVVEHLHSIGVDEIGCFLDFGIEHETVLSALPNLVELKNRFNKAAAAPLASALSGAAAVREEATLVQNIQSSAQPERTIPLTESQRGLWALSAISPDATRSYNEAVTLQLRGPYEHDRMQRALQSLVNRHEALRTRIGEDGENQVVAPAVTIQVPLVDLSETEHRETTARELLEKSASESFDSSSAHFLRAVVIKLSEQHHILTLTFHHVLGNGPSYWIFLNELCALYTGASELPERMQLSEFVRLQPTLSTAQDEEFWQGQFVEPPPPLDLPLDHPRPPVVSFRGDRVTMTVDESMCRALRQVGAARRCSLFMTLFAAFNVLLHRLSGQDDLVVGVPFESGIRERAGGDALFANTTNVMPLRSRVEGDPPFTEYLEATKGLILAASEHQEYFFGRLLNKLHLSRDPARSPLFSVLFNFETGEFCKNADGLAVELVTEDFPYRGPVGTTMNEIYLNVAEKRGTLEFQCDFCTQLFKRETIERWFGHLRTLLQAITVDPTQPVSLLPILTDQERKTLVVDWNHTWRDCPTNVCLHELIEAQVERTPDAVALVFENESLTYREVNRRANRLAHHLRKLGVGPEAIVGIFGERSLEMVIGLVATLKAGGAYLPLDPTYPTDRLAFMLADAQPAVVLMQRQMAAQAPPHDAKVVFLEDKLAAESDDDVNPVNLTQPENLAYVIYTSGSTGQPKGAMNTHRGICNRLLWMQEQYRLTAEDRVLQKTPFSFDVSVWEFFWPLLAGARLVVARPGLHGDSQYLINTISGNAITTIHFVPSMLAAFLEDRDVANCSSLRQVICSGEALPVELQDRFFAKLANTKLDNLYGPTEAAVDVTFWKCERGSGERTVPIGRPVANTQIYVLDRTMQPVPPGVAGELHIGGVQLARGYLAKPELTAEKFVPNPFGEERLYKTGDLARYRSDGAIEFLGRIDHQVKIRGFRIELGEIEAVLKKHGAVRDCVVLVQEEGDESQRRLVAYVVAKEVSIRELREHAQKILPDYMVPSAFVFLDKLPMTSNGKLDRRALPKPQLETDRFVEPRTALERKLAEIWQNVLGVERVGADDNFFELGGDSLTSVRVANRLHDLTHERVSVALILQAPTVSQLADLLVENYDLNGVSHRPSVDCRIDDSKIAEMRALITPARRVAGVNGKKNPRAIFILSPMRSGSTLTRIMLSGHPGLFAPPELQLLQFERLSERRETFTGYDRYMLEGTLRAIMELEHCDLQQAKARMAEFEDTGCTVREFYAKLQQWVAPRFLVDKTPDYAMDIEVLRRAEQWFENAFYIHLARHPLGMIRSYEKGHFVLESPYRGRHNFSSREIAELTWLVSQENILAFLKEIPGGRQIRIQFEQLVREPQKTLEDLCEAIGIDFNPAMLRPYEEGRMTDGVHPESQQVGDHNFAEHKGLRPEIAESWRSDYSEESLGDRTRRTAQKLGYGEGISAPRQVSTPAPPRSSKKAWSPIVTLQSRGSRPPFFSVHDGYGSPMFYGQLARCLGDDQPFYSFQPHWPKGTPYTTIESMAASYVEAMREVQARGPYFLGGYCTGGVIAFEMAQQLYAAGEETALLALFSANNPQRPPRRSPLSKRIGLKLEGLSGQSPIEKLRYFKDRAANKVRWEVAQVFSKARKSDAETGESLKLPFWIMLERAKSAYQPCPYPGEIVVFRGTASDGYERGNDYGWAELAGGGLEIQEIPGCHHGTMFERGHVPVLAEKLNACISAALSRIHH